MEKNNRSYLRKIKELLRPPLMILIILLGFMIEFLMELPFIMAMGIDKIVNSK